MDGVRFGGGGIFCRCWTGGTMVMAGGLVQRGESLLWLGRGACRRLLGKRRG